jgi:hypothetical protein
LLNPHLFTHLFHEGVIVSTRKLVYDAGSNEEAIKALMQAQHKAVMKDLRKGAFDDKIDQYLGGTPGLEPRGTGGDATPIPRGERAPTEADPLIAQKALDTSGGSPIEIVNENLSEPIELPVKGRTATSSRADAPAEQDVADAVRRANAASSPPPLARTSTAPKVSKAEVGRAPTQLATKQPPALELRESSPLIEMTVGDDDEAVRQRGPRDTAVDTIDDHAPRTLTPSKPPASHGAAALPAMKAPSRPIAPPVVTRPPTQQDRKRPESDVVEVYSPAPPSAEPPPGERGGERPGQYSMSRKEGAAPIREKTGRVPVVNPSPTPSAGTPPPRRGSGQTPAVNPHQPPPRSATQVRGSVPAPPQTPSAGTRTAPQTQARIHATAPITNRTPSPAPPQAGSGVVMTRPAVIVGAPPKPQPQPQRVRKAREDEGRGFGQGLISEKSLDEVILAYLSEDAEDK